MAICSRNADALSQTAEEIAGETGAKVLAIASDLYSLAGVEHLIGTAADRFGGLDIVVNNSGGPPVGTAEHAGEELWEQAVQVSLMFFARMSREAIPHMRSRGGGRIIKHLRQLRQTAYREPDAVSGHAAGAPSALPRPWPTRSPRRASWSTTSRLGTCLPTG